MNKSGFTDFLTNHYKMKNGNRLSKKAVSDCVSRAERIEKLLGIDLDRDFTNQADFANIIHQLKSSDLSSKITNFGILDCTNALKKYGNFKINY